MRTKYYVFCGIVVVIGIAWYFWPIEKTHEVSTVSDQQRDVVRSENIKKADKLIETERRLAPKEKNAVEEILDKVVAGSPKLSKIRTIQQASNRPIEFYGKVVDQHNNPVPYAKVTYSVLDYEGVVSLAGTSRTYWKDTDTQGDFSVSNLKGEHITISKIEKDGYEFEFLNRTFHTFSQWKGHKPLSMGSKEKPVLFRAWKKTQAEPLIYSKAYYGFYSSGKPYVIDLQKGKKFENSVEGDLEVVFERVPEGSRASPSDWSVVVTALGGGVYETTDTFMNMAPESGYSRTWDITLNKHAHDYKRELEKHFYIKSRSGKAYSKVKMRFLPYYKDDVDVIEIEAWLNPNGSRNLQYDPSKRIPLKQ